MTSKPMILPLTIGCLALVMPTVAEASSPDVNSSVVEVVLKDGTRQRAVIDAKTSNEVLWLRFETSETVLLRPVRWGSVEQVLMSDITRVVPKKYRELVQLESSAEAKNQEHGCSDTESGELAQSETDAPKSEKPNIAARVRWLLGFPSSPSPGKAKQK